MSSNNRQNIDRPEFQNNSTYPLASVHRSALYSQNIQYSTTAHTHLSRTPQHKQRIHFGLGINPSTGRLQWCPGLTWCKFLLFLTVAMLPLTLLLLALMRMDAVLGVWQRLQQHELDNNLLDIDYNSDSISTPRRCPALKTSKYTDYIEHDVPDLLRDARTSFLPYDSETLPPGCNDELEVPRRHLGAWPAEATIDDDRAAKNVPLLSRRRRSTGDDQFTIHDELDESAQSKEETLITNTVATLESFWNEQGNRDSVRKAQAKTMAKYMDTRVDPCVDFYKYACGNWERLHPIPKDKAGFDTFEMLRESLDLVLKQLLEAPTPPSQQNPDSRTPVQLATIKSNHYDQNTHNTQADIAAAANGNVQETQEEREEKLRLRQHIIEHRDVLEKILLRIKRQNTSTKRKRLIGGSQMHNNHTRQASNDDDEDPASDYQGMESAQIKAKQLYQSCINSKLLAKRGIDPLLRLVRNLGGWPVLDPNWDSNSFDWLNLTAHLRRYNNDIFIVEWVGPDIKNSDENVIQFDQTNLGLPTREYFLQDNNSKYLRAYQRFMSEVLHKMGASKNVAQKTAASLISFETRLAAITSPAEMRLNVTKLYKRMSLKDLSKAVPQINWIRYLSIVQERTVRDTEQVVIFAEDYMRELVSLIAETPRHTVANYLIWRFVRHRINNVDERFDETKQHFYHALFGREESPSRWKVCVAQVNTNMGMAVGAMFVSRYFDENSKRDTLRMTHEIQQAFRDILRDTNWIDDKTKKLAEEKVNAMSLKIGYPDFILNENELNEKYDGLTINPDQYFENTLNVLLHTARTEQQRLSERVNKTHWQTAPAIVNAYYSRNKNQIMFPAGILQPPFYHRYFPRALNFGGIGVVIGHELTHGFDDKGRLFDSNGNIHKWWSDFAIRGFDDRARCIIAQYSNYTVSEVGIKLNGESTQGENIADNGGIRQAFHAYSNWLKDNPNQAADEQLPGLDLTGPQLFFLNFGQVWCGAMRTEAIRNKLNTAIHSPGRFRVIGTLSNSYDFAREFNCPANSPMNPERKCTVW